MSEHKHTAPSAQDQFDDATSRQLEAVYLTPDVVEQREKIMALLAVRKGEKALDIGCGPGLTTLALAEATGASGKVTGVDIAEPMLAIARKRCANYSNVNFTTADVTALPYEEGSFDIALATQVYEYVEHVDQALHELARVVKPGGRVLIVDTDWESAVWASQDDVRMRKVIDTWNTHIPHPQLPRDLKLRMKQAGFKQVRVEVVPLVNTEYDAQTYSVGMMTLLGNFAIGRNGITEQDILDWNADARVMGEQQRYFFSLNRYVFMASR
jgi:ubiquinone/menaquinone biosynthesis C-methylase UbiE